MPRACGVQPPSPIRLVLSTVPIVAVLALSGTARAQDREEVRYLRTSFDFEDVDLPTLQGRLERIGIEIPLDLEGTATLRTRLGIPVNALRNTRAYRLNGTITAPRLVVEGLELRDVTASVAYANGVLNLTQLRFEVPPEGGPAGVVAGEAVLALDPRGDLEAEVRVTRLPISPLLKVVPDAEVPVDGRVTGEVTGSVPLEEIRDLAAWSGKGRVTVEELSLFEPLGKLTADAALSEGTLTLESLEGALAGGDVTGEGTLELSGKFPLRAELTIADVELGELPLPIGDEDAPVTGTIAATADLEGTLQPLAYDLSGTVAGEDWKLGEGEIESFTARYDVGTGGVALEELELVGLGGRLTGSAIVPLDEETAGRIALQIDSLNLSNVPQVADLPMLDGVVDGTVDVTIPAGVGDEPQRWTGAGRLRVADPHVARYAFDQATLDWRLAEGVFRVDSLRAQRGTETLTATGQIGVTEPYPFATELKWQNGRVGEVVASFVDEAAQAGGRFDTTLKAEGQLPLEEFAASGAITLHDAKWNDLRLNQAVAEFTATDERLRLQTFTASLYGGTVTGSANVPLTADAAAGEAHLEWRNIAAGTLLDAATPITATGGTTAGRMDVTIPQGAGFDPAAWQATGNARVENVTAEGWKLERAAADVALRDRTLRLSELVADFTEGRVQGTASLGLAGESPFEVDLDVSQLPLALPVGAVPDVELEADEIAGWITAAIRAEGTLSPLRAEAEGTLRGENWRAGPVAVDAITAAFNADGERFTLENLDVELYGGTATGTATLPLDLTGPASANLAWEGLGLSEILSAFESPPVSLDGRFSGELDASADEGDLTDWQRWTGDLAFQLRELETPGGQPLGQLAGDAELTEQRLRYELTGEAFGGTIKMRGWYPDDPAAAAEDPDGRVETSDLQLERLLDVVAPDAPLDLTGLVDLAIGYSHDPDTALPTGTGRIALRELRWDEELLTESLAAQVVLTEKTLAITGLAGTLAGGRLQSDFQLPLDQPSKPSARVMLTGVDLEDVSGPLEDVTGTLRGRLDVQFEGRLGGELRLAGRLQTADLEVYDVAAGAWRARFLARIDAATGRIRIRLSDARGELAGGRVKGSAKLTMGRRSDVEGSFAFTRVRLERLLGDVARGTFGDGRVAGTLRIRGRNLAELTDAAVFVDADLGDTRADAFPLVDRLRPILAAGLTASTTFTSGEFAGVYRDGVLRIQRLSLVSDSALIYVRGTVTAGGRLDLALTADTGGARSANQIGEILLARLLDAQTMGATLLLRANSFLSNRVIDLSITGTLRAPVIRVRPFRPLAEEGVRFFLTQAFGV